MRIAVIGSGISGNLVARLLSTQHDVVVYEAGGYLGGHANTVSVEVGGQRFDVDTGFMVFNRRTYPNFCRLLELLNVESRESDMSFSVRCENSGLEYQGSSLNGLFAQRRNLLRPAFYGMLLDIVRFNRQAVRDAKQSKFAQLALGDYLRQRDFGLRFQQHYLYPMIAAIWSADPAAVDDFPLQFLIAFMRNHGLLQIADRPRWRTLVGGSRAYVDTLMKPLAGNVRLNTPVHRVVRYAQQVVVEAADGDVDYFDQVVFATHADQTLKILDDPTPDECDVLGAFPYQSNVAVLHTDRDLLPSRERAWASWNYRIPADGSRAATVTYDLGRLQGHDSEERILLTLNDAESIKPACILRRFRYEHPTYNLASPQAQRRHSQISGSHRTHFCGAYWGYGFHEDGVNSALTVAKHFGIGLEACTVASTKVTSPTVATAP